MILGLRSAIYPVTNLESAKKWYAEAFGQQPYFDQPYYVGFSIGGFELGLIPDGEPGIAGTQAYRGVENADATFECLISLGAAVLEPVRGVGEGIRVAALKDPFGNRLGIIENPHFDIGNAR